MKRLLSLLLASGLLLSMCACSAAPPDPGSSTPNTDISSSPPDTDEIPSPSSDDTAPPPQPDDETQLPEENEEQNNEAPEEYIRTIDPYAPMVALTFDDGPHELYSTQILDILEQNHAVATFFEVGYNARCYPEILVRMVELGCELASHTNAHHDLTTLSRDAMLTDLAKLDQIIYDATGITPTLVRPPYGAVNSMVKYESGRAMILWTVDTQDWLHRDAQVLIDYLKNYGDLDGEVVLMHSIHASTAEAMAVVIPWLIEQGYQLVTVSELMAYYYGELLEANHYYSYNYFARHERTEYPLELPVEPMQTDIPPYNTVPVVPNAKPEEQPSAPPPEENPSEQPPEGENPAPDDPPPTEDPSGQQPEGENPAPDDPPPEEDPSEQQPEGETPAPDDPPPTEDPSEQQPEGEIPAPDDPPPTEDPSEQPPEGEIPAPDDPPPGENDTPVLPDEPPTDEPESPQDGGEIPPDEEPPQTEDELPEDNTEPPSENEENNPPQ